MIDQPNRDSSSLYRWNPEYTDPVIEAYKKDIDRTLLRQNLQLTPEERFLKFVSLMESLDAMRETGRVAREERKDQ